MRGGSGDEDVLYRGLAGGVAMVGLLVVEIDGKIEGKFFFNHWRVSTAKYLWLL